MDPTYYQPVELMRGDEGAGLWHFASVENGKVTPVGYCSPWERCPACEDSQDDCRTCGGKHLVCRPAPCPGHPSPEEARVHYRTFLLDAAHFGTRWKAPRPCAFPECGDPTHFSAEVGEFPRQIHFLCSRHRNRAGLEMVMEDVTDFLAP